MKSRENTDILLTKDEAREIFSRAFQAQEGQNLKNLPVAVLQAWACKVKAKAFDEFKGECDKSSNKFRTEVDKSAAAFMAEVEKAARKFDNAIKSFRMK